MKKYKAKDCYILRKVAGNDVLISIGHNIANFNGYIKLNSSAVLLWETLKEEKTEVELRQILMEKFCLEEKKAEEDIKDFLEELRENKMVEEID